MTTVSPVPISNIRFREALDASREELGRIPEAALAPINLDIPSMVVTVLGCVPEVKALESELRALPFVEMILIDSLERYALAAGQAHTQNLAASAPPAEIPALSEELFKLRALLTSDVQALGARQLLDVTRLANLRGTTGHKNIAFDVLLLSAMLRDNWNTIAGKTGVSIGELDHAERQADRLATALGIQEQGSDAKTAATLLRQQAYTRLLAAYSEARRAVSFLRWHKGDVDTITPSLYAGKTRSPAQPNEPTPDPAPTPNPAPNPSPAPAPQPGNGPGLPNNPPFPNG